MLPAYAFSIMEEQQNLTDEIYRQYDYVRYTVSDMHGIARHELIPARHCSNNGIQKVEAVLPMCFDGSLPKKADGELPPIAGNVRWRPFPETLHPVPWARCSSNIGQVICETERPDGSPQLEHPRYIARRQVERLRELGYSVMSAYEYEFVVLDKRKQPSAPQPVFHSMTHYANSVATSRFEEMLISLDKKLHATGIDLEALELELAGGQFETPMAPRYGIRAADEAFIYREAVKEMFDASDENLIATFMSRPHLPDQVGSGCHYNHSLWCTRTKRNAFAGAADDPTADRGMSQLMLNWVAGLLWHLPSMCALLLPTINCYRRIHQGFLSPRCAEWGIDDRSKIIRCKTFSEKQTYIECRLPGAASNPYLVQAAVLAAGMDGLNNNLKMPTGEEQQTRLVFPKTLKEAIDLFPKDQVLMSALGEEFWELFLATKRSELEKLEQGISFEEEQELYWNLI